MIIISILASTAVLTVIFQSAKFFNMSWFLAKVTNFWIRATWLVKTSEATYSEIPSGLASKMTSSLTSRISAKVVKRGLKIIIWATPEISTAEISANTEVYIGVTGVSACLFTVQARNVETAVVFNELLDGVPQDDTLSVDSDTNYDNDEVKYYAMRFDEGHKQLKISTSPRSGTLSIFVSYCSQAQRQAEVRKNMQLHDRIVTEFLHN